MQLANLQVAPLWYFIFGAPEKSSLAKQFASEHSLLHIHLTKPQEATFSQHVDTGLVVQCSATFFREVEPLKKEIQVVFLHSEQISVEEAQIKKDYESIGRCVTLKSPDYKTFRRELYPKLIIVFGPCPIQKRFLSLNYFQFSGYILLQQPLTANDMISKLPKQSNYILFGFVPEPSELTVLQQYFTIRIVHLKHQRTELREHEDFFNLEARIYPQLSKKLYFQTITSDPADFDLIPNIGEALLPELIYVNATNAQEKAGVIEYVRRTDSLLLNINEIKEVWNKKKFPPKSEMELIHTLAIIIWRNINRKQIFLTDYPSKAQEFFILKDKTRAFTLFADCQKPQKYEISFQLNPAIYFMEAHLRKHIELDFSFQQQIMKTTKYLVVSGPPCVGKTSASKYICTTYGYKHIEYQPYLASVKEKLIAPEDGEDLPFAKIVKHFKTLIQQSGDTPILIDGLNFDWKDIDTWVQSNGPPIVLNLKTDEKQLIRRTRKKNQADVAAQVSEEQAAKAKQVIAKNADWADQVTARCPNTTLYQIDFSPQLILAEKLLDQILKPRVFLIQDNFTNLFQNIAIRHSLDFFDLKRQTLSEIAVAIRKGNYRNVILCNYQQQSQLVCQDFDEIEKRVGLIRYLAIWNHEDKESKDEELHLEPPPKEEKPKPAEGEQGGESAPPAEEEGEPKKKVFNIYQHKWTKTGNAKNISQWFYKLKKNIKARENKPQDCYKTFDEVLKSLSEDKQLSIYEAISLK